MELITPHGGALIDRVLTGAAREAALERVPKLRKVRLHPREVADLELIATGALSPLTGFMNRRDYRSVVREMRLENGLVWGLPVALPVSRKAAAAIPPDTEIALVGPDDQLLAVMTVTDVYPYDKGEEAREVYRTSDGSHPGVKRLIEQGDLYLGGDVWVLNRPRPEFPEHHLTPVETRRLFAELGWAKVVGFQTRNPVHRAHEYIQKCALEICDGLLLHPLVGETKADDIPAATRMEAYQVILERYYPKGRTLLSVFPAAMRYAGPREAIWHALCRKNYGCTHFIVGRDHAGVGKFYNTYDAQKIFDQFQPTEIGITPLCFEHTFFCRECGNMASAKTCPHGPESHVALSGTKVREMLSQGVLPPPEFTRPEVARVLMKSTPAKTR
ncbi:MAG TPA: sulfate adenylyltransferase [Symbiobacteriaceae bacterium]|jgi:ATP sulfurylase